VLSSKRYSASRINGLSDGVFAIAMTLLIFNLQVPDLDRSVPVEQFNAAIVAQAPHLASWLISFAILCRLWLTHNRLMADMPAKSAGFTGFNFVLLGAVAFVPFPAALLGEHPLQPASIIVFSITYAVAALAMAGMGFVAPDRHSAKARKVKWISLLMLATAVLACLLTLIDPRLGASLWVLYLALVPLISHFKFGAGGGGAKNVVKAEADQAKNNPH
jgi:uncharacterized membrane protein